MKISSHEEYGLRCLLQIGRRGLGESLTIPEISEAEDISTSYVAKLLRILRQAGFVKSVRGKAGGYALSRPANRIVVGDVLAALGGRVFASDFCERHPGQGIACVHSTDCAIRSFWHNLQSAVDQVVDKTTLQDLLPGEPEKNGWVRSSTLAQVAAS